VKLSLQHETQDVDSLDTGGGEGEGWLLIGGTPSWLCEYAVVM